MVTKTILDKVKSIKYVVALGVCMGKDSNEQKLGDVIISNMICDCTNIRREADKDARRGGDYPVGDRILKKIQMFRWQPCSDATHD